VFFRPHPQPLSHRVGEGYTRVPPLPPAGEGDKGGEGNTAHLLVHACAGKNSPCFKDFVPNRCTLTSSPPAPLPQGGRGVYAHSPSPARRKRGTQGVRAHRWVHGVQANKWCQVHFRQVRALPKLELSEEQIVELVRQLSPDAKRRVMQLLGSVPDHSAEPEASVGEFAQLPCFGMWADHEALQDSDAWVRKERERWHRRASRRD